MKPPGINLPVCHGECIYVPRRKKPEDPFFYPYMQWKLWQSLEHIYKKIRDRVTLWVLAQAPYTALLWYSYMMLKKEGDSRQQINTVLYKSTRYRYLISPLLWLDVWTCKYVLYPGTNTVPYILNNPRCTVFQHEVQAGIKSLLVNATFKYQSMKLCQPRS
jgi:hypothetical protein